MGRVDWCKQYSVGWTCANSTRSVAPQSLNIFCKQNISSLFLSKLLALRFLKRFSGAVQVNDMDISEAPVTLGQTKRRIQKIRP